MDEDAALDEIRRAAQATLDAWPEARAAVLFGSRARGNHSPDSDWDIAFITTGDGDWNGGVPDGVTFCHRDVGQFVNEIAIPEALVERKALCIGHVGRGIVTDGRILAGKWSRPEPEGKPFMETESYKKSIHTSLNLIKGAVAASSDMGLLDDQDQYLVEADSFVACTADAAEHLARAIMGQHGLDARHSHDLHRLATQARKAGHELLAQDVIRMNGATRTDHVARYKGATKESLAHAVSRLPMVLDVLRKELANLSESFLDTEQSGRLVDTAARMFLNAASSLRAAIERDGPDKEPPPPHDWIAPLIKSREALASTLEATAEALRVDFSRSGNDDWLPPEPSPFGEDSCP